MIIDSVVGWFLGIMGAILTSPLGLIPSVPGWLVTALGQLSQLFGWVHQLDHWVPVNFTFAVVGAVIGAWLIATTIQAIRVIVSYLTLGGGAT